jgi:hypothetical protein
LHKDLSSQNGYFYNKNSVFKNEKKNSILLKHTRPFYVTFINFPAPIGQITECELHAKTIQYQVVLGFTDNRPVVHIGIRFLPSEEFPQDNAE